jgi:agmatine deiminase
MPNPKELGFRMPAEWEKHSAIWLSFPHDNESFPHLEKARAAHADFAAAISETEQVELQVLDETMQELATSLLTERNANMGNVRFHVREYADIWFRDYGPLFVTNGKELAMTKWEFNAWGNKYEALLKDNGIPYEMNKDLKMQMFETGMVLEGGSIDVNGKGALLTTEQCLLNKNRNPDMTREQIEQKLKDNLGVSNIIWLKEGVEGDDTDGHIDDIARFVNENTIVCAVEENEKDANYAPLKENFELLKSTGMNVVPLPMPGNVTRENGSRLPASYANFYIGNGKVIVPIFGTENDGKALEVLRSVFPDRKVVGINALYLVYGFGTFHCMSQQQPLPYSSSSFKTHT